MYTAFYTSPVGIIKIECSDEHVHSILFYSEEQTEIVSEFNHPLLQTCSQQLTEYFEGKRKSFDLPLQQNGTTFQQNIWEKLQKIPYGKTISYMDLARQTGDSKAIRAVGAANGKNHIAIVVPCHRVIGSNAKLTGYAGGLWRKRWLLEHEAKYTAGVQQLFAPVGA
ncbi:MAG: methylated-DNA--[protein]-cysteine S-methyltransferase [Chitinophagaceae bacterium]|nr:methylated-DNA--[protein]-cysteine S-methyltransferase [Chitinophagaceae bacterium]